MSVSVDASGVLTARLNRDEVAVLRAMVDLLCRVCNDPAFGPPLASPGPDESPDDLLARLSREWTDASAAQARPEDPATRRLFPDACPSDADVSADFRRLTLSDQRLAKLAAAEVVRAGLDRVDGRGRVRVLPGQRTAWLTTLAAIRLVLAARLGIDADDDDDRLAALAQTDPRHWMYNIYMWTAWLQESVVECLTNRP